MAQLIKVDIYDYIDNYSPVDWRVCDILDKENYSYICSVCGDVIGAGSIEYLSDGNTPICHWCMDDKDMQVCDICGLAYPYSELECDNNDTALCSNCAVDYSVCPHCGEWVHNEDMVYSEIEDQYLCSDCYNDRFAVCENCGTEMYIDDAIWINDDPYCEECYFDRMNSCHDSINDYYYKPSPVFYNLPEEDGFRDKVVYFGIELEVSFVYFEDRCSCANELLEEFEDDIIYLKRDGSIGDYGFEIVSHPLSSAYIYKNRVFERIYKILDRYNADFDSDTGMHIHIGRNKLKKWQWVNFIDVFQKLDDFIYEFSERDSYSWDRWCRTYEERSEYMFLKNGDRYHNINLENNSTIEVRVFKSPSNYTKALANIELIQAIMSLAMHFKSAKNLSSRRLLGELRKLAKFEYENLANYIGIENREIA